MASDAQWQFGALLSKLVHLVLVTLVGIPSRGELWGGVWCHEGNQKNCWPSWMMAHCSPQMGLLVLPWCFESQRSHPALTSILKLSSSYRSSCQPFLSWWPFTWMDLVHKLNCRVSPLMWPASQVAPAEWRPALDIVTALRQPPHHSG